MERRVDLIDPFVSTALNVLETMAFTTAIPSPPQIKMGAGSFGVVSGIIGMVGDELSGNLLIGFDEKSILAIVSRMLTEQYLSINNDVIDAVGEITNIICGGAKKGLSQYGYSFEMATPMVVTGSNLRLEQMSNNEVLSVLFTTPEGQFVIESNVSLKSKA